MRLLLLGLLCACSGTIGTPFGGRAAPERPIDVTWPRVCDAASRSRRASGDEDVDLRLETPLGLDDVADDLELAPDPVGGTFTAEVDALRMRDDRGRPFAEAPSVWCRGARTLAMSEHYSQEEKRVALGRVWETVSARREVSPGTSANLKQGLGRDSVPLEASGHKNGREDSSSNRP